MEHHTASGQFSYGVENLVEDPDRGDFAGERLGLIVNPTSVDRNLVHTVDRLDEIQEAGKFSLSAIFAPEHGLHANLPPTVARAHHVDARSGLNVWSLYSETRQPTPEMLAAVDVLLFDLQDVGVRYYTFIWTMYYAMAAAAKQNKRFVVLDRPNPLGGLVAGPVLEPRVTSFVGLKPVALQHGMTVGELARLFNDRFLDGMVELSVIPMQGYEPCPTKFEEAGLWVPPSPNLPHLRTVWAHAATGLFDGTTASHGEGTPLPFEWVGHPSITETSAHHLAADLNQRELPGVKFRPMFSVPSAGKWAGEVCGGVQMHVVEPTALQSATVGVHMLAAFFAHSSIEWLPKSDLHTGRSDTDVLWIDRLVGNQDLRWAIDKNIPADEICLQWESEASTFEAAAAEYRLY